MRCDTVRAAKAGNVLPGARHHLARVGLSEPQDVRNLAVGIVERLPEDVRRSFGGRQLLHQYQEAQLQRLTSFHCRPGIGAGVDRFQQPGPDGRLPPRACGLHDVDRHAPRRRCEERGGVANQAAVYRLPAQPDVLHKVLGLGRAAKHAAGDPDETRTHAEECRETVVG